MLPHVLREIGPQFIQELILRGAGVQIGIGDLLAELFGEVGVDGPEDAVDVVPGIGRLVYLSGQAVAHQPAAQELNLNLAQGQIGVNLAHIILKGLQPLMGLKGHRHIKHSSTIND